MSGVNSLLTERLKKKEGPSKAAALAKQSASGNLTGFAGIFGAGQLSDQEKETLQTILEEYSQGKENINQDLTALISISSEVKAINNQAALLHGERIKKAHKILTKYQDGAFTAWLVAAYGNRQTPYNFLQYFEFYEALPKTLRPQIELMPRQAIYTLASRDGSIEKKQEIIEEYEGQTKDELLRIIRDTFPLAEKDRRRRQFGDAALQHLRRAHLIIAERGARFGKKEKQSIEELINSMQKLIKSL